MDNNWNPQEILKIAVKVEEHGQRLYAQLEERANDKKLKDIWNFLKEQEINHKLAFEDMLDKSGEFIVHDFGAGEYEAYLDAIGFEYIFTPQLIEKKTKEVFASDLEAVEFALYIEKESILVYEALKKYITQDKQHILDKIIKEEMRHVVKLVELKKQLV